MKRITLLSTLLTLCISLSAQWQTIQIDKNYASKNDIRSIVFDTDNNIWIGTSFGVYKQEKERWILKTTDNVYIESLNIAPNNTIRGGVWGGGVYMSALTNDNWEKDKQSSLSMSANSIFSDSKGDTWIGTWDKGIVHLRSGKATNYTSENALIGDNTITCFAEDKNNTLWVGTSHGISSFDGTSWRLFNTRNSKLKSNDIYALTTDAENNLWIGTPCGLIQKAGDEWNLFTTHNSDLPSNTILCLATDKNNVIWIGTNKGIIALKNDKQKVYTSNNCDLIDNRIQTIAINNNKIYIGTPFGLSVLDLSTFNF